MLKTKSFEQRQGYCGPASLKMVLSFYGLNKTEKELAKLSGASKSRGVGAEGILRAAKKLGFKGFKKDFSTLLEIRKFVINKKTPVIVDWFSKEDGHYSVVVDINKENIYLEDPELGRMRALKLSTFNRIWFDFPGSFLKSKKDIIIRRMIVIYK